MRAERKRSKKTSGNPRKTASPSSPRRKRLSKTKRKSGGAEQIAGLRAALREKEFLLREIHHRIKNNIQIIASLLRLEAGKSDDDRLKAALLVCQSRIRSIALIHEKLYQSTDLSSVDLGDYARTLALELFRLYGADERGVRLDVRTEGVRMLTKKAVSCGLILSELVVNAFKHAFPSGRPGMIAIEVSSQGQGRTSLVVSDDGIGLPADFDARKTGRLGMQIVSDLVKQIDGEMHIDTAKGTTYRILF